MRWIIIAVVIIALFNSMPPALAFILGLALVAWSYLKGLAKTSAQTEKTPADSGVYREFMRLTLLRGELRRRHQDGKLSDTEYHRLCAELDDAGDKLCKNLWINPAMRREHVQSAWDNLNEHTQGRLGAAPWQDEEAVMPLPAEPKPVPKIQEKTPAPATLKIKPAAQSTVQPASEPAPKPAPSPPPEPQYVTPAPRPAPKPKSKPAQLAWRDKARQFAAQVVLPFLWQNIGWFISGFLFVSGSIFLVASTTGFAKNLAVLVTLCIYAGLLFWGGYQLRRKRPELETTGSALLMLAVTLVPLIFAAQTRLITAGGSQVLLLMIALSLSAVLLPVSFMAVKLASGLIDRILSGEHPALFVALAALQLALPLLLWFPWWQAVALLHITGLVLLAYAVRRFAKNWLQGIFVDKNKIAYYAAGTLIYTAVISFVHLTLGSPAQMPPGYSGPFVMALCGLLFYADTHLRQWVHKQIWLGRFSFVVYALSVLALMLSWEGGITLPLLFSLGMALLLYGLMIWHYTSLPPLYLFIASAGALYYLLFLRWFPEVWHFLLSLPFFALLAGLQRFARYRESALLAITVHRISIAGVTALVGWSLFHASPGIPAMLTPLTAAFLVLSLLGITPARLLQSSEAGSHTRCAPVIVLIIITLAYAPVLLEDWFIQIALALAALSGAWGIWAIAAWRNSGLCAVTSLFNGALFSIALSLALFWWSPVTAWWPWILAANGAVLAWLSLSLRTPPLVYASLAAFAGAGVLVRLLYIPSTGSGFKEAVLMLLLWAVSWVLSRRAEAREQLEQDLDWNKTQHLPALKLSRFWSIEPEHFPGRARLWAGPLQQVAFLLWLLACWRVTAGVLDGRLELIGATAALSVIGGILIAGQQRWLWLLPVVVVVDLTAVIAYTPAFDNQPQLFPALIAAHALWLWFLTQMGLIRRFAWPEIIGWRGGYGVRGGRYLAGQWVHATLLVILCAVSVTAVMPFFWFVHSVPVPLVYQTALFTLAAAALFFLVSGWQYRYLFHSYAVLGILGLFGMISTGWSAQLPLSQLNILPQLPAERAALALLLFAAAWLLQQGHERAGTFEQRLHALYRLPFYHAGLAVYVYTALDAGGRFIQGWTQGGIFPLWLPAAFILLIPATLLFSYAWQIAASLRGVVIPVLAIFALSSIAPEYTLSLLRADGGDLPHPLILAAWSIGLWVVAGQLLPRFNRAWPAWAVAPLFSAVLSVLFYFAALAETLYLLATSFAVSDLHLSGIIILLALMPLPLFSTWPYARQIRGILLPVLLSLGFAVFLIAMGGEGDPLLFFVIMNVWALLLWLAGNEGVPRFNHLMPAWEISAVPWYWFGLIVTAGMSFSCIVVREDVHWLPVAQLALYLFLFLRNGKQMWVAWTAVTVLLGAGVLLLMEYLPRRQENDLLLLFFACLLWLNFLLQITPWWARLAGERFAAYRGRLQNPLFFMPLFGLLAGLLFLGLVSTVVYVLSNKPDFEVPLYYLCIAALIFSFLHALLLRPLKISAHALLFAGAVFWLTLAKQFAVGPPFVLLWWAAACVAGGAVLARWVVSAQESGSRQQAAQLFGNALWFWLPIAFGGAFLLLLYAVDGNLGNVQFPSGLALLVATLFAAALYVPALSVFPLYLLAAALLAVLWLHLIWFHFMPQATFIALLPWYALQFALLSQILPRLQVHLPSHPRLQSYNYSAVIFALLAGGEWLLHAGGVLYNAGSAVALFGPWDAVAALIAMLILLPGAVKPLPNDDAKIYVVAFAVGLAAVYLRLIGFGAAPLSAWDTAAIMFAGYVLLVVQHLKPAAAWYRLTLLMPVLALLTVPMQSANVHAGAALLAGGTLYLLIRRSEKHNLSLYLGLLVLNLGVYLWVPQLAGRYGLLQLYVVPAAVTVLLMVQLHWLELRPNTAHAVRLAALSALYAGTLLDVFMRPGLGVFVLALGLSLGGVFLGIALRTRAFLYTGICFLLLNIAGQLINFYPEDRFGKAVILMLLGGIIAMGMLSFSLKREQIMQRWQALREDLGEWK